MTAGAQRGEHFRFSLEAGEAIRICRNRGGEHLEGDLTLQVRVRGAIHLAHSAFAEERGHFIGAETRAASEIRRGHGVGQAFNRIRVNARKSSRDSTTIRRTISRSSFWYSWMATFLKPTIFRS